MQLTKLSVSVFLERVEYIFFTILTEIFLIGYDNDIGDVLLSSDSSTPVKVQIRCTEAFQNGFHYE